jgi:GNAT superfamily N-acetyltransferase
MNIALYPIASGDWPKWWEFQQEFAKGDPQARTFTDESRARAEFDASVTAHESGNGCQLVQWDSVSKDRCIGEAFTRRQSDGYYTGIVFLPDACGMGLGRNAMETLVAWGKQKGLPFLLSSVWETNHAALCLNLRCGYIPIGARFISHPYTRAQLIVWKLKLELRKG